MPLVSVALLAAVQVIQASGQPSLPDILSRVAEEAEVLQQNAPKVLTQETLEQRAVIWPGGFRPRIGAAATQEIKPRLQVREVVSEYSVGTLHDSDSRDLIEFRQVITVDGRKIQSPASARHALSLGVHSEDDRIRKRMLEDFAKHGLVDVATDYAMILLAFSKRGLGQMKIAPAGEETVGPEEALVLSWAQTSSAAGELEFRGREVTRRALKGDLWVRKSDGLPLRIKAWVEYMNLKRKIRDEATVDYAMSPHGFVTPASVVHRHYVDGQLMTENLYRYEPFKMFGAESDIKFTEEPDSATSPPAPATPPPAPPKK